MDFALKYHFSAAEREAYQKSTYCQKVTNHSSMSRYFMMQEIHCRVLVTNHLGSIIVCKQHSVSRSKELHRIITGSLHKSFRNALPINTQLKVAQVHKINHIFTYTQLPRSLAEVQIQAIHQTVESNATFFPKTHVTVVQYCS
jgi:hypothetical protein